MAILDKSRVIAAKIETTFNVAEALTDADTLTVKDSTKIDASMDTVQRSIIKDSLLAEAPIPVREKTSGNVDFELTAGTQAGDELLGDVLWEAGMGKKSASGSAGSGYWIGYSDDGTTPADMIYTSQAADTNASTATGYTLASTTDATKSLTIKEFVGTNKSVTTTGNVVSSIDISIPTADVATVSFSIEGCGFETNESDTKLSQTCTDTLPYLGKSATFTFDGGSISATNVSIKIANTVFSEEGITSDGYTSKAVTGKEVTGSFTLLFEDYSMLTKLQNNTNGSLFIKLTQGSNEFGVYIPTLKITSFGKTVNNGVISQDISFAVIETCAGQEPIIIANKTA